MHAGRRDTRQPVRQSVEGRGLRERHAELVLGFAGRDLVVGLGVDIGIDPDGDPRDRAPRRRHLAQRPKLGLRLDIEGEDAGLERKCHLLARLADAGENDQLGRHLDRQRAAQLAFRHHVHAGAEPRQRGQHAEIGIGLDRVADERAGRGRERIGEHAIVTLERRAGIAIERGSYRGGEIGKVNLLGVEHILVGHAAPVGEMMHCRGVGLFEQFIDPQPAIWNPRHLGGRVGLGLGIAGFRPVKRASASTGRKPDRNY